MRIVHLKNNFGPCFKYATSIKDVTRYLYEYHKISTDIMKSGNSWYMHVRDTWYGVGASSLDKFPIQHWATIYKWLIDNPESDVNGLVGANDYSYLLKDSRDITVNHAKYKSYII